MRRSPSCCPPRSKPDSRSVRSPDSPASAVRGSTRFFGNQADEAPGDFAGCGHPTPDQAATSGASRAACRDSVERHRVGRPSRRGRRPRARQGRWGAAVCRRRTPQVAGGRLALRLAVAAVRGTTGIRRSRHSSGLGREIDGSAPLKLVDAAPADHGLHVAARRHISAALASDRHHDIAALGRSRPSVRATGRRRRVGVELVSIGVGEASAGDKQFTRTV
jgi:hypothetical protein